MALRLCMSVEVCRLRSPAPLQSTSLADLWAVVTVWCVPSSPIAVICCGTGVSAWVGQVATRFALTGRFTVMRCYFFLEEAAAIRAALRRSAAMDAATDEFEWDL